MLWLGDYHNARQLLQAIDRRLARAATGGKRPASQRSAELSPAEQFYRIRQGRAGRSRTLSLLLVPLEWHEQSRRIVIPLARAPEIDGAVTFAYGDNVRSLSKGNADTPVCAAVSLQELIGAQGAHQWHQRGVDVPSLGAKIHPRYGTFMPTRHEYVDLVAQAPLPGTELAFDIGTGTGVLSALLVRRGVKQVIGTDIHERAVQSARENFERLGIAEVASAQLTSMFPDGRADLIVCNPPWLPGSAATTLDAAIYDPGSKMLLQFLAGLPEHLAPGGEGWLIISDIAELLGLRTREVLLEAIAQAGLRVVARLDTVPTHNRAHDETDVLHEARSREVTSLWRLRVM